ncbi:oryzin precursor [Ampelomyces quisqualis]|uniref:Oryzin n=1 Tax=Ampelomyces quisqualis TaxID=50730 RepID=A0A6A5QT70_AMPQU|nr:oryzin precursor [Ampelomyces quisqualis]
MHSFIRLVALAVATVLLLANVVASRTTDDAIPGEYIVQLKLNTSALVDAHHEKVRSIHARNLSRRDSRKRNPSAGIKRKLQFGDSHGYAGSFDETTIKEIEALPEVLFVEPNYIIRPSSFIAQTSPPWNLAMLSSPTQPSTLTEEYVFDWSAGKHTFSYVIDSGIRLDHEEFEGRAIFGHNAVAGSTTNTDETGHGTVASIIGGKTFGVAKMTTLVAVKVLGAEPATDTYLNLLNGLLWAVKDIVEQKRQDMAVINLSISTPLTNILDKVVSDAYKKGVLIVASAGNYNQDAGLRSPCSTGETICVGSVDKWKRTSTSNYGPVVNIFAAGENILTASHKSKNKSKKESGTSMSAAHVTGLVSYLRGLDGPSKAHTIKARIYDLAIKDILSDTKGSKNLLAYNGAPLEWMSS